MNSYRIVVAVALAASIVGCAGNVHMMGRRGMEGRTHTEGVLDSAIRMTRTSLIPRADTLVRRTEQMTGASQLHEVALSVRSLVRQMDALHPAGTPDPMTAAEQIDMTAMHRAVEALVGDLEKAVQAATRLRQYRAGGNP